MVVGTLEVHLRIEGCRSLKDKRHVLRPLIERLRRDFHVAVAEVADNDLWNVATIGVSCVSTTRTHAEQIMQSVTTAIDEGAEYTVQAISQDYV